MMQESIDIIRGSRSFLIKLIEGISIQKLNEIPSGFHNNIIWNIAHAIATQQSLCYVNADMESLVGKEFIEKYKTGTKPEGIVSEDDFQKIKGFLVSTIDQFEKDVYSDSFNSYHTFDLKSYPGVRIGSVKDAIKFAVFHEGLHLGYIMALKKVVNNDNSGQA